MNIETFKNLLTIQEASEWASSFLDRNISESNISYLIQYGKVKKYGVYVSINGSINDKFCFLDYPIIF